MNSTMNLSPILVFVYNRPEHTRRCLESLQADPLACDSDLYIFSDGAKASSVEAVAQVREVIRLPWRFKSVRIVEQAENRGLARNIIEGVTSVTETEGRAIVVEDDLVCSPYFLTYMNEALELYRDDERVWHVTGHILDHRARLPETFFLRFADSWGWGTWHRAWRHFNPDGNELLTRLRERNLCRTFDLDGAFHFTRMLEEQIAGKNNSWAIRWNATVFLADKLMLAPDRSLVDNKGFDNTGTHCGGMELCTQTMTDRPVRVERIPVEENPDVRAELARVYRYNYSYRHKLLVWLRMWYQKLCSK